MYTVFKTNREKIIFAGTFSGVELNELFEHQYGFLCRREVLLKKLGRLLKVYFRLYGAYALSTDTFREFAKSFKKATY